MDRPVTARAAAAARPQAGARRLRAWIDTVALVAGILVLWQALYALAGEDALSAPAETVRHLLAMMGEGDFWPHVQETFAAFIQALAIAWTGGLCIGVALGANRLASEVFEPILVALYSIPKVTLYPVILLFFGLGMQAKVAFGAIHGIIPVAIFAMAAVRNIRPIFLKSARAMRLTARQRVTGILIPATIPEIVTGFRIGFALTMLGTLIGEMFASQRGLGFLLIRSIERHDVKTIMAVALLLFAVATLASWLLLRLDKHLHHRA